MKIAVITQIRNESKRLKEWIEFHSFFHKIDHFLFYLDNPEDNSEEILNELKKTYSIDYKFTNPIGEYNGNNHTQGNLNRQLASFKDGFIFLRDKFDWIAIFDVDEWIVPNNINDYDLKKTLSDVNENILYLPMYNFTPPFDYDKSITEQNFYRWSCQERIDNEHLGCGKSIIRGKIYLDKIFDVDVHLGPSLYEYRNNVDFNSTNHTFRLHQFQGHMGHSNKKYEVFDDSIKKMFKNMRKKIAVISGWYNFGGNNGISEDYRFMTNCFYESAKKYFLPHHDVEFIFMNNSDVKIDGVTNINFDYKIDNFWHMCLMKILSLKYLEDKYDYIFVNDNDQIFIKEIGDEILESDFTFLDHYFAPPVKGIHEEITDIVELNFNTSEEKWTMGNFFGGKQKNMIELLTITEEHHKKYFGHNYNQNHFYSRYPEELFIIKYIFENNINHKRLNCCFNPLDTTSEVFLGDFSVKESDHFKIKNTKLLHGTKQNLNKLKDYMIENKKIVVCQFYTSNVSYGKYSEKINQKYCEDNGYGYYVEKDADKIKNKIGSRSWTWFKPFLVEEVLNLYPDCEYVLFLDIDAIFCNNNRRIEEFITNDFSILMTEDYGPSLVNAGVMLIKNNQFSKDFLKNWWDICEEFPQYKEGLWHDQTCIGLLHERLTTPQEFKIIDNFDFNARTYNSDRFIFHAFSYGNVPNRTIDSIYYKKFDIPLPTGTQLLDIIQYYPTDKHHEHNFFNLIYNELFKDIYLDVKTFIEIGVSGGESIKLWRDYFVNSEIIGFENNLSYSFERLGDTSRERMTFIDGDQSKEEDLIKFSETYSNVDVILDDGSHKMRDQQITLAKLFKMLKSDGIYILEDLHTSFEVVMPEKAWCGWGDSSKTITLNMLESFKNTGKIVSDYMSQDDMDYLSENIKSIEIYKNRPDWSVTSVIIKK